MCGQPWRNRLWLFYLNPKPLNPKPVIFRCLNVAQTESPPILQAPGVQGLRKSLSSGALLLLLLLRTVAVSVTFIVSLQPFSTIPITLAASMSIRCVKASGEGLKSKRNSTGPPPRTPTDISHDVPSTMTPRWHIGVQDKAGNGHFFNPRSRNPQALNPHISNPQPEILNPKP